MSSIMATEASQKGGPKRLCTEQDPIPPAKVRGVPDLLETQ